MEARRIECKITDSLVRFKYVLNQKETTQQDVHDIILTLQDKDTLNEEESVLIQKVLNAFLSLSFIIKANEEEVDKFIEYFD
tara:strand:+ start:1224 stop:1469 length:246 start_codon:yes stop_codon:yes gene_type:complete